ncbi:MAG: GNAT family N-acetyltransferase [Candidatus Helarchaeota archaeon]
MDFEIKKLNDPLPIEKISTLYKKTYFEAYFDAGANDWNSEYTDWYFAAYHHDKRFFYSAWKDEELLATLLGTPTRLSLENEVELNSLSLGLCATQPKYQRQGIQKVLLSQLIEEAKAAGIDLIYAFPEKGFGGNELLKQHYNFKRFLKNAQHYIKVLGDYGRQILRDYRGLNIVLAKLLKLYSGIPENTLQGGKFRDATMADLPDAHKIVSSYQKRVPLCQIWTQPHFKEEIEGAERMNKLFEPPWGFFWKVWERDGKILATMFPRIEMIHFKNGSAPVCLLSETCFAEETTIDERVGVLSALIHWVLKEHPKVFTVQTTQPQYENKVYKELKFIDDTSTYEFLVLPLTKNGEEINRYQKYKEFFIPYHR